MRPRSALHALALAVLAAGALPAGASALPPLHGPHGTSSDKVLVIGTDGTRWDLLRQAMAKGKAPHLKALMRRGFGRSTLLPYTPDKEPRAFTMSAVGWTTIASGVGPAKHGVTSITNLDPEQATKHGYLDFLTRLERVRPRLSTFMVGDWGNLGLHFHGGPIFGDEIDVKRDTDAGDTAAEYDREDARDARLAATYLRHDNPDAGFVYFGVVDETAHNYGSATARYRSAIARTDARIGRVLRAVKSRATYSQEHWTIIVTTDHGQRNLSSGSILSHGFGSKLERTSFVIAAGPGVRHATRGAGVVDINPTVVHQMGIKYDPKWHLDGRTFIKGGLPTDVTGRSGGSAARPTLGVTARQGALGGTALRLLRVRLPRGVTVPAAKAPLVKGSSHSRHRMRLSVTLDGPRRTVTMRVLEGSADRMGLTFPAGSLSAKPAARRAIRRAGGLRVRVTTRGVHGAAAKLQLLALR